MRFEYKIHQIAYTKLAVFLAVSLSIISPQISFVNNFFQKLSK